MNEGHSALLGLELFFEELAGGPTIAKGPSSGSGANACSPPTPRFPPDTISSRDRSRPRSARRAHIEALHSLGCCGDGLNMTRVALSLSHYVNGVTQRHGRISRSMFPGYPIGSITNGVHSATWSSPSFQALYDRHIKDWRRDSFRCATRWGSRWPKSAGRMPRPRAI